MLSHANLVSNADAMVAHSAQVESVTSKLLYETRDLEAAAALITGGLDAPSVRRRVAESQNDIPALMARLIDLTTDNPRQQVRVGELKAKIEQRREYSLRIIASSDRAERLRLMSMMVDGSTMRGAATMASPAVMLAMRSTPSSMTRLSASMTSLSSASARVPISSSVESGPGRMNSTSFWNRLRLSSRSAGRSPERAGCGSATVEVQDVRWCRDRKDSPSPRARTSDAAPRGRAPAFSGCF